MTNVKARVVHSVTGVEAQVADWSPCIRVGIGNTGLTGDLRCIIVGHGNKSHGHVLGVMEMVENGNIFILFFYFFKSL